jgi:hypothetical protein
MKINEFSQDPAIRELISTSVGGTGMAPASPAATSNAAVQQVQQDPQAQAKMMAQQALDRQNRKKEIQDQIKAKQSELQDLQRQLAQIQ